MLVAASAVWWLPLSAQVPAPVASAPDGAAVFERECSMCHNGAAETRAPAPEVLRQRSPEAILSALTAGGMRPQGGRLTGAERRAVAEFLTGRSLGGDLTGSTAGRCTAPAPLRRRARNARLDRLVADQFERPRADRGARGPDRGRGAEADAEVGVRVPRLPPPRGRSRRSPADGCSSAARTAPSTRSTRRAAASSGRSRRRAACAPRRCSARVPTGPATPCTSATPAPTSTRSTPRPARRAGHDGSTITRSRGSPALADARRRAPLRAGLLARRDGREPAGLRVLHVPRQRRRARARQPAK